jgi:hypothetical protein
MSGRALRRLLAAAAIAALALPLAACFPAAPSGDDGRAVPRRAQGLVPLLDPRILAICPATTARHLDQVVAPTDRVLICRAGVNLSSDGITSYGPWELASSVPRPARLVRAYRVADAPRQTTGCPAGAQDPLLIWVDRGGVVRSYYAPVDGCGDPQAAAATLYRTATREAILGVDTGAPGYRPTPRPTPKEK